MAEIDETEMPTTSTKPETEWSTREKLAIASYVSRTGEQRWSGAGRQLRPLGEPGRPTDWFSPKFCAQQYTALMEQLEAPKRKRSERSDSSENIQPGASAEEIIIDHLTKERIDELKKQVRHERTEYRKLKREIELIESGALDDQLDDLINEIENGGSEEQEGGPEEHQSEQVDTKNMDEDVEQLAASIPEAMLPTVTHEQAKKKRQKSQAESEPETKETLKKDTEKSQDILEKMDTAPKVVTEEPKSLEPANIVSVVEEQNDVVVTEEQPSEEEQGIKKTKDQLQPEVVAQPVADKAANNIKEVQLEESKVEESSERKEEKVINVTERKELAKHDISSSETAPVQEADSTYHLSVDDETKQSISLPGTPAPSGGFHFDSFPSSPALSYSSDMDPDATASWKAWKKSIMILWKQIASHRLANIFLTPVTDEIAPNYSTTVYKRMDLIMIKKNIESGAIRTTSEFQRDIMLMFQNAIMYNNIEHDVYKMATEMQKDVVDQIAQYLATQMMMESAQSNENKSLRRSTIRRSAMSEKAGHTRSRRSAAADGDAKSTR